jgi:hypothetical protein
MAAAAITNSNTTATTNVCVNTHLAYVNSDLGSNCRWL